MLSLSMVGRTMKIDDGPACVVPDLSRHVASSIDKALSAYVTRLSADAERATRARGCILKESTFAFCRCRS